MAAAPFFLWTRRCRRKRRTGKHGGGTESDGAVTAPAWQPVLRVFKGMSLPRTVSAANSAQSTCSEAVPTSKLGSPFSAQLAVPQTFTQAAGSTAHLWAGKK